jgi:uncharacterized protein
MSDLQPDQNFKRKRTSLTRLLIILGLTYLFCLGYMVYFQRSFMYFPGGLSPQIRQMDDGAYGAQRLEIEPESGLSIRGWYWPPDNPQKPVVIYFHGNAQAESYWLDKMMRYRKAGFGFVLATYRGYSGNDSSPSEQGLYNDARGYINAVINNHGVATENIVLLGESLGGGVAVQMASEYPNIHALVLESTYSSIIDVARKSYWFFPVGLVMMDRFDSMDKIGGVRAPILIVHGDHDTLIPYSHAERLYNAAQTDKKLVKIEGGTHHDLYNKGASKYVVGFLNQLDYSKPQ